MVSADGRRAAFASGADNLVAGGVPAGSQHVYVVDVASGTTWLADRASGEAGAVGNSWAGGPALDADGGRVAFWSAAQNLDPVATDGMQHVYVRDLKTAATTVVDRRDGAGAAVADSDAAEPSISADGCPVPAPPAPGGGGGGGGGTGGGSKPGPGRDTVAPVVSGLRLSSTRFAVGADTTAVSARAKRTAPKRRVTPGTTIRYRLSEAGTVTFAFSRSVKGRRVGKRCVKATVKLRGRKACTPTETFGTLARRARAGASSLAFTGRIGRRALPRGRWSLTVVARDAAGNRSRPRAVTFTVVRG